MPIHHASTGEAAPQLALKPSGDHSVPHSDPRAPLTTPALIAPFRNLVIHRDAIRIFVSRDIRGRYINSVLGLWWAVIQPLALLALYTFVFSIIMRGRLGDGSSTGEFALYLFCGLLPWLAISDALTRSSSVLIEQSPLIKKVVFPSEILPVHLVLSAIVVEIVGLAVFLAIVMMWGRLPGPALLALPLVMVLQFFFTTGAAWVLATLAVYLRDVRQVVGLALTLWMFLTPIVYPASMVPERYQWLLAINPMTTIVEAYRGALLENRWPETGPLLVFGVIAIAVFVLGYWLFTRSKRTFADLL
jgi:lipopolysaccharide transport system permease protein